MSSPTVIRVAYNGLKTLQVVTYFDVGQLRAALQEYEVDPATGRTSLISSNVYSSEAAAIADWMARVPV